jgi:hypothetical protein
MSYFLQDRVKSIRYEKAEQIHWINEKTQVAASIPKVLCDHSITTTRPAPSNSHNSSKAAAFNLRSDVTSPSF